MTHYERIKSLSIEEMAKEIKKIANWNRREKVKAEKDSQFYIKYLNSLSDKCNTTANQ